MNITLEDLKKSKEICEAARGEPWSTMPQYPHKKFADGTPVTKVMVGEEGSRSIIAMDAGLPEATFIAHARTMLSATLKLVEEMYEVIVKYHNSGAERLLVHEDGKDYYECLLCKKEWPEGDDTEHHAEDCAFIQSCRLIERLAKE